MNCDRSSLTGSKPVSGQHRLEQHAHRLDDEPAYETSRASTFRSVSLLSRQPMRVQRGGSESARPPKHRNDGGRRTGLDRIHDLEAMSLVKGDIDRVRRPEVCWTMLPVALPKTVLQQSSSTSLV